MVLSAARGSQRAGADADAMRADRVECRIPRLAPLGDAAARGGTAAIEAARHSRNGTGGSLPLVYAAWAAAIALRWTLCRWFDGVKACHRGVWWTHDT